MPFTFSQWGHDMKTIEYTKKPSIVTIQAAIKKAIAAGNDWIQLSWGENQITIERAYGQWVGHGWIGRNGGQDIADKLNRP